MLECLETFGDLGSLFFGCSFSANAAERGRAVDVALKLWKARSPCQAPSRQENRKGMALRVLGEFDVRDEVERSGLAL